MLRKLSALLVLVIVVGLLAGCPLPPPQVVEKEVVVEKTVIETVVIEKQVVIEKEVMVTPIPEPAAKAKYIFLFIGDGMAVAQRTSAEVYRAAIEGGRPEALKLVMNSFPGQGMNTTYDLTSVIPDSASTGTALATGQKTSSGRISMDADGKEVFETIAEMAKAKGMKVGIVSSVSIDHATPASFYAHQTSRNNYYEISHELANSGFDYFGGGPPKYPAGKEGDKADAIEAAKANGYTVAVGRAEFDKLAPEMGKVWAMPDYTIGGNALYYALDRPADDVTLAEYTAKGIELLDNPDGFFMMVEGGKIDWACHANDAGTAINDTLAFDAAVAEGVKFYEQHPAETLIVVTGDHECGGMTIGFAGTRYATFFDKIQHQTMSCDTFSGNLAEYKETHTPADVKFEDMVPMIEEAFGLYVIPADEKAALEKAVADGKAEGASDDAINAGKEAEKELTQSMALTDLELEILVGAFEQSMLGKEERATDDYTYLLYGGYEPLTVKLTTILNQKAGISWTSYSHTGIPVQTSALGVGYERFNGYYDNTDVAKNIMAIAGFD
ncbi:MAG: alkaline phosphatase [Chloroflexi bacterium]|nr:alkaline phosphatase [Chloroflexota bacterium]